MLQEKHFDLIHFGTVTCNTISGKNQTGGRPVLTIGNKAEEIWGQWVGIQKITTVDHLAKSQHPRWVVQCSCRARRLRRTWGWLTFPQSSFHLPLWTWLLLRRICVQTDHQGGLNGYRASLWHKQGAEVHRLILLSYSSFLWGTVPNFRPHEVNFLCASYGTASEARVPRS